MGTANGRPLHRNSSGGDIELPSHASQNCDTFPGGARQSQDFMLIFADRPPPVAEDSASDTPADTPMARRKQQRCTSVCLDSTWPPYVFAASSAVTRRQKIWRSLKTQLTFRSRGGREQLSTADLLTRSHPDLSDHGFESSPPIVTADSARKTSGVRLKSVSDLRLLRPGQFDSDGAATQ
jgi:hypothetical protein